MYNLRPNKIFTYNIYLRYKLQAFFVKLLTNAPLISWLLSMPIKNKVNHMAITLCITVMFICQSEVYAMSFFGKKVCVFSAVEGTVIHDGEPVRGATIKRTYTWNSKDITDEIKNGRKRFFFTSCQI